MTITRKLKKFIRYLEIEKYLWLTAWRHSRGSLYPFSDAPYWFVRFIARSKQELEYKTVETDVKQFILLAVQEVQVRRISVRRSLNKE